jgi:ArsR family transcriptional regulator, arsenate/arsenite/antimonite-responsive transcriptional repressor / arsenate reductase (thioredoxin)
MSADIGSLMGLQDRAEGFAALGDPTRLGMVEALRLTDLTPGELGRRTKVPSNLLAHHLSILERAGIVMRTRSEGDARKRYVALVAERINALFSFPPVSIERVAFVCTHNSARSQFAAARWEQLTGDPGSSAGTHPAEAVHPAAVRAARAYGLDLSDRKPQGYRSLGPTQVVVSVCDRAVEYGLPPHEQHLHWSIPDPVGGDASSFTSAFRMIDVRLERLAAGRP